MAVTEAEVLIATGGSEPATALPPLVDSPTATGPNKRKLLTFPVTDERAARLALSPEAPLVKTEPAGETKELTLADTRPALGAVMDGYPEAREPYVATPLEGPTENHTISRRGLLERVRDVGDAALERGKAMALAVKGKSLEDSSLLLTGATAQVLDAGQTVRILAQGGTEDTALWRFLQQHIENGLGSAVATSLEFVAFSSASLVVSLALSKIIDWTSPQLHQIFPKLMETRVAKLLESKAQYAPYLLWLGSEGVTILSNAILLHTGHPLIPPLPYEL